MKKVPPRQVHARLFDECEPIARIDDSKERLQETSVSVTRGMKIRQGRRERRHLFHLRHADTRIMSDKMPRDLH